MILLLAIRVIFAWEINNRAKGVRAPATTKNKQRRDHSVGGSGCLCFPDCRVVDAFAFFWWWRLPLPSLLYVGGFALFCWFRGWSSP